MVKPTRKYRSEAAVDHERLLAAIDNARESSSGTGETSELGARRAQAIEAYLGLNTNPAPEGRSQVVDRTVYQTINTLLPSLVRIFANNAEDVCRLLPVGPDDEMAAEQSTAVLNYVVTSQNPWEQICHDWMLDAKLGCNGYVMAYWDESEIRIREAYEGQSEDQMASLLSDKDVTVIQHSQSVDKQATADAAVQYQAAMRQYQAVFQQWQQIATALRAHVRRSVPGCRGSVSGRRPGGVPRRAWRGTAP